MNPIAQAHLAAAARNLTIARDLLHHLPQGLASPAYEWVVVLSFYAAVRSVNGYLLASNRGSPRTDSERNREIWADPELERIREPYLELLNWSRDARYVLPHDSFGIDYADTALNDAEQIDGLVRLLLGT